MKRVLESEVMESKIEAFTFDSYQKRTMHHWWPRLIKQFNKLKIKPNSKILDVAAGPANFSIKLAKYYRSKVWATDLSDEMLKIARKNIKTAKVVDRVIVIRDDAKKMRFKDNTFDFTFCRYMLHQIPNPVKVVNEIWRVTKKNGKIYIYDTVRTETREQLEKWLKYLKSAYKRNRIKNWRVLLKNAEETIAAGLSRQEIIKLFKKSKIKNYRLNFERGRFGEFSLIATKT